MSSQKISRVLPKREIYIGIDLLLATQPIFVHPYKMAPYELKELKYYLKYLQEKDFIKIYLVLVDNMTLFW